MQNFLATTKLQLYKKSQSPQSDLFLLLAVVSTQQKVMVTKKNIMVMTSIKRNKIITAVNFRLVQGGSKTVRDARTAVSVQPELYFQKGKFVCGTLAKSGFVPSTLYFLKLCTAHSIP